VLLHDLSTANQMPRGYPRSETTIHNKALLDVLSRVCLGNVRAQVLTLILTSTNLSLIMMIAHWISRANERKSRSHKEASDQDWKRPSHEGWTPALIPTKTMS
jgi:hypothetical protein